jgi:hypothetical protein
MGVWPVRVSAHLKYLRQIYIPPLYHWIVGSRVRRIKSSRRYLPEAFFMAIQDYVRSIAATETVSKQQLFRFLEMQFARADKDHDGNLDPDELVSFVHAISWPDSDQR